MTNNPAVISKTGVFMADLSDHEMVGCIHKINNAKFIAKVIPCRNYPTYEPQSMKEDFRNVNWQLLYEMNDVNCALEYFNDTVKTIFDRHAPEIVKKVKGKPCPWINSDIRKIMTSRDRMLQKAQRTKNLEHWSLHKKLRNNCDNKIRYAKSSFRNELLKSTSNPKEFWNIIKKVPTKPKSKSVSSNRLKDPNQPGIFSAYYASVVQSLEEEFMPLVNLTWEQSPKITMRTQKIFLFNHISNGFVLNELKKFGRTKATGADGLPPGMLKDIRQDISHPSCYILNLSIETSTVPTLLKLAKIIPVHKSGSYDLPENFKPISVLPVLSKLLEKAVHGQYLRFLENDSLLTDCQYGYRAKRSTNLAAIQFIDDIRHEVDRGNLVGAIFIDFSKAFDTINHGALLTK